MKLTLRKALLALAIFGTGGAVFGCGGGTGSSGGALIKPGEVVPITKTSKDPAAIYSVGDRLFMLTDGTAEIPKDVQPDTLEVQPGVNAELVRISPVEPANGAATVVGPQGTCVGKTGDLHSIQLKAADGGQTVADVVGVEIKGCPAAQEGTIVIMGDHKDAEWVTATAVEVDATDVIDVLETIEDEEERRPLPFRKAGRYPLDNGVAFLATFPKPLPEISLFTQDLCSQYGGPMGWVSVDDKVRLHFKHPRVVGVVLNQNSRWLVVTEDYGELLSIADLHVGARLIHESVLPFVYPTEECAIPEPEPPTVEANKTSGPYPKAEDYCAEIGTKCYEPKAGAGPRTLATPGAPFRGAKLLESRASDGFTTVHLALETETGWYVYPDFAMVQAGKDTNRVLNVQTFEVGDKVSADGNELFLTFDETETYVGDDGTGVKIEETLRADAYLLCGVGASRAPSCARLLSGAALSVVETKSKTVRTSNETRLTVSFKDGILVVDPPASDPDVTRAPSLQESVGPRKLVFP